MASGEYEPRLLHFDLDDDADKAPPSGPDGQSGAEDSRDTHSGRFGKVRKKLTKYNPFSSNADQEVDDPPTLEEFREKYDRTIDELRQRCKRLDAAVFLLSRISTVTRFVDALQSDNSWLTERYNNAARAAGEHNATLHRIVDKIEVSMRKLDPSVLRNVSKSDPAPPETLLDMLLQGYERNINYISNLRYQMDQLERDYKNLQLRLDELRRTHTNELELARKEREDAERQHRLEIGKLEAEHANEIKSLNSNYSDKLSSQQSAFSTENTALRIALTTGDRFQPLADHVISPRFKDLRLLISNLAKVPFRHERINGERLEEFGRREGLVQWVPGEGHNLVVENMIWGALVEGIFRNPFGVLGKAGEETSGMWSQLFRKGRSPNLPQQQSPALELPSPDDLSERWRHTTLEVLRRSLSSPTSPIKTSHASHLSALAATLAATLSSVSLQDHTSDIQGVINTASSLALDFGIQRYRLEIFGAGDNEEVEMGEMFGDSNNMAGTIGVRGRVLFVVSPGLKRVGEVRGGKWGQGKVIVPAMVYLRTDG